MPNTMPSKWNRSSTLKVDIVDEKSKVRRNTTPAWTDEYLMRLTDDYIFLHSPVRQYLANTPARAYADIRSRVFIPPAGQIAASLLGARVIPHGSV